MQWFGQKPSLGSRRLESQRHGAFERNSIFAENIFPRCARIILARLARHEVFPEQNHFIAKTFHAKSIRHKTAYKADNIARRWAAVTQQPRMPRG
jgi:hypothetical protein